ncbi:hypothetical protein SJAG_02442 [Schizosaccharomyces japonicus yFS275]|uniref:Uncharacterized protein n=1 Tax=Schizosaccharomyces japonicus (strain yFS275 / FY16936) TaxID=402676 RepID=B6K2H4_SCHJY|nr:hypothetical protein SJAG_02442 [Schizosaccharomyces japonicus yFS275]EEB07355.1 hypothetical protein SJAG_02442 [Schizosaccharomyces japonicus yFS275]
MEPKWIMRWQKPKFVGDEMRHKMNRAEQKLTGRGKTNYRSSSPYEGNDYGNDSYSNQSGNGLSDYSSRNSGVEETGYTTQGYNGISSPRNTNTYQSQSGRDTLGTAGDNSQSRTRSTSQPKSHSKMFGADDYGNSDNTYGTTSGGFESGRYSSNTGNTGADADTGAYGSSGYGYDNSNASGARKYTGNDESNYGTSGQGYGSSRTNQTASYGNQQSTGYGADVAGQKPYGTGHTGASQYATSAVGRDRVPTGSGSYTQDSSNIHSGQYGTHGSNYAGAEEHTASFTDRMKGSMEKMMGKVSNNPERIQKGEDLKHGRKF